MPTAMHADTLTALPGVRHGFFTRQGGISRGIYQSLNVGQGSSDDRVAVVENRRRVARELGSPHDDVQTVHQVHGANVVAVDRLVPRQEIEKGDALVTRTKGLVIGILTADCTPVLFADAEAGIVAAAHAGWRGAVAGVVEATVAAMAEMGAERGRIRAAIGPCISADNYEVGPDFEEALRDADPDGAKFLVRPRGALRARFDLPGYVAARLARAGVGGSESVAHCTYRNESLFFSYRRSQHRSEPDYGRQISAIVVT